MKRALVTGGSGGIGAAICRRLAADGRHVYVHANSRPQEAQRPDRQKKYKVQSSKCKASAKGKVVA